MSLWRRIRHDGQEMHDLGVRDDGSVVNPNGYPEAAVRAAVAWAEERRRVRRSTAAVRAAATRRHRMERRVYEVAQRIIDGHGFGPSGRCAICTKELGDPESIKRGIGSDCWQGVICMLATMDRKIE